MPTNAARAMGSPAFDTVNRAALEARWGRPVPVADGSAVRPLEAGGYELRTAAGEWVPLGDPRTADLDAARWLDGALDTRPLPTAVCIIGAGTGHVLDVIDARAPATRVLVLEPEPGFLGPLLARRDRRAAIEQGRLLVLAGPDYDGASLAWKVIDGEDDPLILIHPVICRERRDSARRAAQVIGRAKNDWTSNREARRVLGAKYARNTLANLPAFDRTGDVSALSGLARGTPAFIAGAGPSLNANLEALARVPGLRDRALVIATDTALRPCLAAGITPDFAVAVDASEANARHLIDLPANDTWLVAEPSIDPRALAAFDGRASLWRVATHDPWPLLRALGVERGTLAVWGSVLTAAADLALRLGCDPLIFVGADLAYTHGQPYCRGTVYDADWAYAQSQGLTLDELWRTHWMKSPALMEPGIEGAETRTASHFQAFRDWLVDLSQHRRDRRFVNATGAGILRGGAITQMPAADLAAALPPAPLVDRARWTPALASVPAARLADRLLARGPRALAALPSDLPETDALAGHVATLMQGLDRVELTRLESMPVSREARDEVAAITDALAGAPSADTLAAVVAGLAARDTWRAWRPLDRLQTTTRLAAEALAAPASVARVALDRLIPIFQSALTPDVHPGLAAGAADMLRDLCWSVRRETPIAIVFTRDIVEPLRRHARVWADAVGLQPRRPGPGTPRVIGVLGYNSQLGGGHPAARAVVTLLDGHRARATRDSRIEYFAWRTPDAAMVDALTALDIPVHTFDWPASPCGAVAALHGAIADAGVDALITDQNMGVPTVLFEARCAPVRVFLDMGFTTWSPGLTDLVCSLRPVDPHTGGVAPQHHLMLDLTQPAEAAQRLETRIADRLTAASR